MILALLGTAPWVGGVLIFAVMAAIPLLERFTDPDRR
jgi:hypothetical protein